MTQATSNNLSLSEYRLILKSDLPSFIQAAFQELNPQTPYLPAPHVEVIASALERCRRGKTRRLIITLPPRSLKSHCVSISFPAWLLGHEPGANIICASYGQELADKLARDTRSVMQSDWYQALFPARISDRQAVHDFATTEMGGRMATSVGGVVTGRGADFIILDDPVKPEDALSQSQRSRVNEWYQNTLLSRLNNKATGCIIIVMQRLHQDDLVGFLQEREQWEILSFPAIALEDEVHRIESVLGNRLFRRRVGEALQPERESLEVLASLRTQMSEYNFAAQYQQHPTPLEGGMIKRSWLKFYKPGSQPAKFACVFQSWDTANKSGELNDFSVCTTWGVINRVYYLLDVFRARLNYPELRRAIVERYARYPGSMVLIEDKASGTSLIQDLKAESMRVKAYMPPAGNDKEMRLFAQTLHFENGQILLPSEAPWLNDYVSELTGFPGTKYDDQVDSTTQFLDFIGRPGAMPMYISDAALRWAKQKPTVRVFF